MLRCSDYKYQQTCPSIATNHTSCYASLDSCLDNELDIFVRLIRLGQILFHINHIPRHIIHARWNKELSLHMENWLNLNVRLFYVPLMRLKKGGRRAIHPHRPSHAQVELCMVSGLANQVTIRVV